MEVANTIDISFFVINIEDIRRRTFDDKGIETEPFSGGEKLTSKGFLNKYDHKDKIDPAKITSTELVSLLGGSSIGYFDQQLPNLHPNIKDRFEFWGDSTLKSMEIKKGMKIKVKTKGDSIFIESCSKLQETAQNYSGENVLGGWTDKISKGKDDGKEIPGTNLQGVDDSEWD